MPDDKKPTADIAAALMRRIRLQTPVESEIQMVCQILLNFRNDALEELALGIESRKGTPEHHSDIAKFVRDAKEIL